MRKGRKGRKERKDRKGKKGRKGRKGKKWSGAGRNEFREILGYGKLGTLTYYCAKVAIRRV
ncbi:MAG: hypothetical protein KA760_04725 [Steroidobacteraceae bacterium]|jgi:hypothetical protein|nr:hypothetical protein [Steroidobacteraceae bacterium]MBP9130473.1 hypothetical protein [Steroidobacteraceae bacterium]